jgi:gluconate 2-dehydrogenase gamma chain
MGIREIIVLRRQLLMSVASGALLLAIGRHAFAETIAGALPWEPDAGNAPTPVDPQGWLFFRPDEAAMVEAIADRLIPSDELSIGGKEAGCALFIDRQLAGNYGKGTVLYRVGPARTGTPQQGPQYLESPAERYRAGLRALAAYCAAQPGGKPFQSLEPAAQDAILHQLEAGTLPLANVAGLNLFELLLKSVREGFFADPIYGGNREMAGWKMLGFPGARYDYRDYIGRRGQKLDLQPVGLVGRPAWSPT